MSREQGNEAGRCEREAAPGTERLEHQLDLIVSSRVGEDQVAWTIFGIFWAAQVLLVGVLFQGTEFPPHAVIGFSVAVFGVLMSMAWAFTQHRSLGHLERHEDLIESIEKELVCQDHLQEKHRLTMSNRFKGPRARTVMRLCCWGASFAWLLVAVLFAGGVRAWVIGRA